MADLPRVLIIGPTPPPVGGMTQVALDCIESCRRSGRFSPVSIEIRQDPGRQVGKLNAGNILGHVKLATLLGQELRVKGTVLAHLHASVGTSLTVLKNLQLASMVKRAGIPLLLHPHSGRIEERLAGARREPRGRDARWRRLMDRLIRSADGLVVMSPGWRELLASEWPKARLRLLVSGIDTDRYAPAEDSPWADPPHVLSMGQLAAHKGLAELAAAWRSLQSGAGATARLDVLGEARDDSGRALAQQLAALPGVSMHGVVIGEAKIAMLRAARIFVLPSHYENLPVALLEAMACGSACIASSVGAVREVLGGDAGIVIPPRDAQALAAAIESLLSDEPRCRALARAARARVVEQYSRGRFDRDLAELYSSLAKK